MTRYFFEVRDERAFIEDDEGLEFADCQIMQEQAIRAAGMMVGEKTTFPIKPWAMIVRDEQGKGDRNAHLCRKLGSGLTSGGRSEWQCGAVNS